MTDRLLGTIELLQVQMDVIKHRGVGYDPAGILRVDEALIGSDGMLGKTASGWVVDAHHAAHPASRAGGRRPLSIGFTGHYSLMEARFGEAPRGVAGENIVVTYGGRVTEEDLAGGLVVRSSDGDLELTGARVAAPCAEFTSFLLRLPTVLTKQELGDDVVFLDDGMRGFVLDTAGIGGHHTIRVGEEVWVRSG